MLLDLLIENVLLQITINPDFVQIPYLPVARANSRLMRGFNFSLLLMIIYKLTLSLKTVLNLLDTNAPVNLIVGACKSNQLFTTIQIDEWSHYRNFHNSFNKHYGQKLKLKITLQWLSWLFKN